MVFGYVDGKSINQKPNNLSKLFYDSFYMMLTIDMRGYVYFAVDLVPVIQSRMQAYFGVF